VTKKLIVVIGDVINDIIVRPLGPVAIGTDTPSGIERSAGGSGANQAAWLAALHARVRFAGRAGDQDAAYHLQALERLGVEASIASDNERCTGTIVVMVSPDGERSMFTDRGANAALRAADLSADLLEGAALLHVSGYPLFEPATRPALRELWATAKEAGIATSVDPASVAGLTQLGPGEFLRWTAGAELAFPNLDEGRLLTGRDEPEAIVGALLDNYRTVALKLGAAGALVASPGAEMIKVRAEPAPIVDSTGAGDAFCAGFLASWAAGHDIGTCARAAVTAAAQAVGQVGARPRIG
jgi:sugar/nucleoside kinase (ribokinase family)